MNNLKPVIWIWRSCEGRSFSENLHQDRETQVAIFNELCRRRHSRIPPYLADGIRDVRRVWTSNGHEEKRNVMRLGCDHTKLTQNDHLHNEFQPTKPSTISHKPFRTFQCPLQLRTREENRKIYAFETWDIHGEVNNLRYSQCVQCPVVPTLRVRVSRPASWCAVQKFVYFGIPTRTFKNSWTSLMIGFTPKPFLGPFSHRRWAYRLLICSWYTSFENDDVLSITRS